MHRKTAAHGHLLVWIVCFLALWAACANSPPSIPAGSPVKNSARDTAASPWEGRHPPKVQAAFSAFSRIDPDAPPKAIRDLFGVVGEPIGGDATATEFVEVYEVSPGYRLALTFEVDPAEQRAHLVEASLSAPGKPGFAPDEWHTLHPSWFQGEQVQD